MLHQAAVGSGAERGADVVDVASRADVVLLSLPSIVQVESVVEEIVGDPKVSGIVLRDTVTGETRELPVTGVFIAIGHDPRSELVKGQVDIDSEGYVLVKDRTSQTNLEGVFACGDLIDHSYRQAITAAGSGCAAALDAERFLSHA